MRKSIIVAGIVAGLTTALGASAQEANGQTSGQANVGMSLPGSTPATVAAGTSDHDQMVGRLAVGYLGRATLGAGAGAAGDYAVVGDAPIIGIRYWISSLLGIDAGIGLGLVGGSFETTDPDDDGDLDSFTGFAVHAGVPLSLASTDHFSFQIIPEANLGFASADEGPDGDISHSGFHFDIGARAGAEIHFGFMKIPQLSLQGSVGLLFAADSGKTENPDGAMPAEISGSRTSLGTTVGANPWNIFTSNVAALYYF